MCVSRWSNRLRFKFCCRAAAALLAMFACAGALPQESAPPAPVSAPGATLDNPPIEDLFKLTVSTVTRQPQTLDEVPAAVTMVTAADIRKYDCRTLAEARCVGLGISARLLRLARKVI